MTQLSPGIVITQPIANRILLAIDAISEARALANVASQTDFNLLKSVWLADYSLEFFAPAICDYLGKVIAGPTLGKKALTPNLEAYLDGVLSQFPTDTLVQSLTEKAKNLHSHRNKVQHGGTVFGLSTIVILCADASEYMSVVSRKVFNLDIEEINFSLVIEDLAARLKMNEAYSSFKTEDYDEAAFKIAEAYAIFESNALMRNNDLVGRDWREVETVSLQLAESHIINSISRMTEYRDRGLESSVKKIARLMHFPDYPSKRGVSFANARQDAVEG